jgi:HD-GYP domain-containing protein (c-di-GMP phosphodiesterase class II)
MATAIDFEKFAYPSMTLSHRQLVASDITLGKPLPFSVYDVDGRLLLRLGIVIAMPDQLDRLIARKAIIKFEDYSAGTTRPALPASAVSHQEIAPVYEQIGSLIFTLKHIFMTALKTPEQIDLGVRIRQMATKIQALCAVERDSALAAPQLDFSNPYIVVHQIMGAVLTEVIAARQSLNAAERLPLVCAALTRDIGQLAIQNQIDQCDGPLPDSLRQALQAHPARGVELLSRAGITESTWLDAILQHHERLDGSGYPHHLQHPAISLGGRLLAIADSYSAMIKPRPYRNQAHFPSNALRDIYRKKDSSLDGDLIQTLIKEIGLFPPGSVVRLKSGEIGVIKHATHKAAEAIVFTVYDRQGMPLLEPVRRDAGHPDFEILDLVPLIDCRSAAVTIKRLWTK